MLQLQVRGRCFLHGALEVLDRCTSMSRVLQVSHRHPDQLQLYAPAHGQFCMRRTWTDHGSTKHLFHHASWPPSTCLCLNLFGFKQLSLCEKNLLLLVLYTLTSWASTQWLPAIILPSAGWRSSSTPRRGEMWMFSILPVQSPSSCIYPEELLMH